MIFGKNLEIGETFSSNVLSRPLPWNAVI